MAVPIGSDERIHIVYEFLLCGKCHAKQWDQKRGFQKWNWVHGLSLPAYELAAAHAPIVAEVADESDARVV